MGLSRVSHSTLRHGSHFRLFMFLSRHKLSCKYVGTFTLQGSKGWHVCDWGDIRYESANYLNFHARKKRQTILLAMRLVLVLLATFLQFPISFLNLQNLIGLYAFNNVRRRQMLAIKLLLYTDTGGSREEDEIDD